MKEVITPIEMRAIDKNTEHNYIPTIVLMENAGSKIAEYVLAHYNDKKRISIYSGSGGNGGDGFVIARHLLNHGWKVKLKLLSRPEKIKNNDSKQNYEAIKLISQTNKNLNLKIITDSTMLKPDNSDIIIDAILGTGVNGHLRQPVSSAIDIINNSPATVLSVDVPSGMDPLTGKINHKCVVANTTLTLHKIKTGLTKAQKTYVGDIHVCDIGIPQISEEYVGKGDLLKLKTPEKNSHKGQNGRVLILGSNNDYTGAVIFAANACLKANIDLVYIIAPEEAAKIIKASNPEFIVRGVDGDKLSTEAYKDYQELEQHVDTILIGPGAGQDEKTGQLFNKILDESDKTIVIDADALKLVDKEKLSSNIVVTPHKNEFTQLYSREVPDDIYERIELLK